MTAKVIIHATARHVAGRAARGRPKAGAQQPAVDLSCRAGALAEAKSLDKRPATGRWRTNMGRRVDSCGCVHEQRRTSIAERASEEWPTEMDRGMERSRCEGWLVRGGSAARSGVGT
jgi:hypothetical protein